VEFRIQAAEDTQPVVVRIRMADQLPADTVEVVVDTVLVAGIVQVLELDMMSAQEQDMELDTDWVLEERRKVELRYILLCFPCSLRIFVVTVIIQKKQTSH